MTGRVQAGNVADMPEDSQTPAAPPDRDRFIPMGRAALIDALATRPGQPAGSERAIRQLGRWLTLLFHLRFFEAREALKDRYPAFDPDQPGDGPLPGDGPERAELFAALEPALEAANFRRLGVGELALDNSRAGRVRARVVVPDENYEEVRFYGRGRRIRQYTLKTLFGLRRIPVKEPIFDFVVFAAAASRSLPPGSRLRPGGVYIKLFRDIPQGDLNTLYPDARVAMKLADKLIIGIPAVAGGVPIMLNILPALSVLLLVMGAYLGVSGTVEEDSLKQALAALSGLGALAGFLVRQWTKYERQKLRYQKLVLDNAYFNSVNNNRGFFDFLIGASEESEVKEAILAYAFLMGRKAPVPAADLDREIEDWLRAQTGTDTDFELDDALRKLRELGILGENMDGLTAVEPQAALAACNKSWDALADSLSEDGEAAEAPAKNGE